MCNCQSGCPVQALLAAGSHLERPPAIAPTIRQRLLPFRHCLRQRRINRLMRQVLLARKEPQKRPPLLRDVIANRAHQHRVTRLDRIHHRPHRHRSGDLHLELVIHARQVAQMIRESPPAHAATLQRSWQRLHLDRQHRRQIVNDRRSRCRRHRASNTPARPWCRSRFRNRRAIHCHGVAQHIHIAIFLRQALGQRLPLVAAGLAAPHLQRAVNRDSAASRS